MKNIYTIILFVAGILPFAACSDDRDSNPTYKQPETFVLNTPELSTTTYDLKKAKGIELTCVQPDYDFTASTTYAIQISLDDKWIDATETEKATYEELETSFKTAKMNANAVELDKAIMKLSGWMTEEEFVNKELGLHIRLKATVNAALKPVYSNSVKLKVMPYFIMIYNNLPAPYYLIGDNIGDGKWTNNSDAIGISMIPLALVEDFNYNKATGAGEFVYTGYFSANKGFKLVGILGTYDEQWGSADGTSTNLVRNDNDSKNIQVSADGWYEVRLNSIENSLKITPKDVTAAEFTHMEIVGTFDDWGGKPIVMKKTEGTHSHVWYADIKFDADANVAAKEGCKFRTDEKWINNWGGVVFPYNIAVKGGEDNIPYKAGSYRVILDDLNSCYYFFEKQ